MKRTIRNYIIRIAIIAVLSAAVILIARALRPSWAESTEQRADQEITQKNDLVLWYYDEDLTPYVKQLEADYFRKEGLHIGSELVSVVSFFENINRNNLNGEKTPDLYITDTTRLEQAYLGSVAKQAVYPDLYTLQNYSVKSLTSVRYGGKQVAYPLCFDMEYFVYNKSYMDEAPKSFAEIAHASEVFVKDKESPVDMEMLYDPTDLLFNYHFIGGSMNLGGDTGDDDTAFDTEEVTVLSALRAYQDFSKKVKINKKTTTYDLVENSFVFGRSMTALLKCSSLSALNREGTNYEIAQMPEIDTGIPSRALSTTWCVCVNPMSADTAAAEKLAKFMTYDNTSNIYDLTGFMSCRRMDYKEAGFDRVYELYDESASLPKLIETEELWRDIKQMLNSVWDDAKPIKAYSTFRNALDLQLSDRTRQETP